MYLKFLSVLLLVFLGSCTTQKHEPGVVISKQVDQAPKPNATYQEIVSDYISSCEAVGSYINQSQPDLSQIKSNEALSNIKTDKIDALISDSDVFIYNYQLICKNNEYISFEKFSTATSSFGEHASKFGKNLMSTLKLYPSQIKSKSPDIYSSYREQAINFSKISDSIASILESSFDYYHEVIETNPKIKQHYRANRIELML